jgi:hypothetical protein
VHSNARNVRLYVRNACMYVRNVRVNARNVCINVRHIRTTVRHVRRRTYSTYTVRVRYDTVRRKSSLSLNLCIGKALAMNINTGEWLQRWCMSWSLTEASIWNIKVLFRLFEVWCLILISCCSCVHGRFGDPDTILSPCPR